VAWSPDGNWLASAGGGREGGQLFVWEAHSGERHPAWGAGHSALAGHPGAFSSVAWNPSGELLIGGGSDGRLRWWKVDSGRSVRVREAHQGTIHAIRVSSDGRKLASCGDDGAIMLWELERGEHLRTLRRDRPYERLDITGIGGLTRAEMATLRALGAVEDAAAESP
jgi:WD40 repeat protein